MIKKNLSLIFTTTALILILTKVFIFINRNWRLTKLTPTPIPTPPPIEQFTASPSAYATDDAILKIEKDLEILENDLGAVRLDEPSLKPPIIDLQVEY